ncbi:hypothetical protein MmarC5_0524 [Methanococcus maripaludis C5]|uniref:Uncharacterized protein n=1 Tax=Methanococcus maripaludis (strain C5 / ATCC BAA-1333) TaxID=402880 RepID=A4FXA9_METM5|nr:hypothetical protein [Methanococcus maripaludis]ABO34838.1 hypothetical protein MmarC5_0524 [Methanococcus maripaludis C5]
MIKKDITEFVDIPHQKLLKKIYNFEKTIPHDELFKSQKNGFGSTYGLSDLKNWGMLKENVKNQYDIKKNEYTITPLGKYVALLLKRINKEDLSDEELEFLNDYTIFNELFEIPTLKFILKTLYHNSEFISSKEISNGVYKNLGISNFATNTEIKKLAVIGFLESYVTGSFIFATHSYRLNELGKKVYEHYNSNPEPITPPVKNEEIKKEISDTDQLAHEKGKNFESYVMDNFFPKENFDLLHVTPDAETNEKRYVESSRKPDLQFRDKKTGKIFYVECKYRSRLFNEKYVWAKNTEQAERYRNIEYLEEIPVYIAMGLMGTSDNPKKVFLMPLCNMENVAIFLSVLKDYEIKEAKDVSKILNS